MHEGMLHIRDVEGPKKTRIVETRLEAMEQQVFKCQGMVEHGLNANHMMITEFTSKHRTDANDIGKHLSRLYDRIDQLHVQIYDPQNQNYPETAVASGLRRCSASTSPTPHVRWRRLVHFTEEAGLRLVHVVAVEAVGRHSVAGVALNH
ncbi:40S ribosomal protein S5-1 [Hordeum vulgare]|nr:40S ribosomal protein S5-1 [Hordeum vulgare]